MILAGLLLAPGAWAAGMYDGTYHGQLTADGSNATNCAKSAPIQMTVTNGRASGIVVDWAWFSTIGYVDVFWTILTAKAAVFAAVFALSALLLWVNGTLAWQFASLRLSRLAALVPDFTTTRTLPAVQTALFGLASPRFPWRLLILGVALVIALLIAMGETGQWDLILRFIYQVPYGQTEPLFDNDIGFYLFSLPVYIALKN